MGQRGSGGSPLPARDGAVPRALPSVPDQGPRQARGLQAGEIDDVVLFWFVLVCFLALLCSCRLGSAWLGLACLDLK